MAVAVRNFTRRFLTSVKPDEHLAKIVGTAKQQRPVITQKVWNYIKGKELQEFADKRIIKTDAVLKKICDNKRKINMLQLTGFIAKHFR